MRRSRTLATLLALIAIHGIALDFTGSGEVQIPGSYQVRVCNGPCSFSKADKILVDGILVLGDGEISPDIVPENQRGRYRSADPLGRAPNGCFILHRIPDSRTFAGLMTLGWTTWESSDDRLHVFLYGSSDATYVARVTVDGDGFRGTGTSEFSGFSEPLWPADTVAARRLGPPDPNRCVFSPKLRRVQPSGAVEPPHEPGGRRRVRS
jgi:hypothetical protein